MTSKKWLLLAIFLYLITFGLIYAIVLPICVAAFLFGIFISILNNEPIKRSQNDICSSKKCIDLSRLQSSIPILPEKYPYYQSFSGSRKIDKRLDEFIDLSMHEFVESWYWKLSPDKHFPMLLHRTVRVLINKLSIRLTEIDWTKLLTYTIAEDFVTHIKIFRQAQERVPSCRSADDSALLHDLYDAFFDAELRMEQDSGNQLCRDYACMVDFKSYLRRISDLLLHYLMSERDFKCNLTRSILREICTAVLHNTLSGCSQPHFINRHLVTTLTRPGSIVGDDVFSLVKKSKDSAEILAIKKQTELEIERLRTVDDVAPLHRCLASVINLRDECEKRLQLLLSNNEIQPNDTLSLDFILNDALALEYFIIYLDGVGGSVFLSFCTEVDDFIRSPVSNGLMNVIQRLLEQYSALSTVSGFSFVPNNLLLKDAFENCSNSPTQPHCDPVNDLKILRKEVYDFIAFEPRLYPGFISDSVQYLEYLSPTSKTNESSFNLSATIIDHGIKQSGERYTVYFIKVEFVNLRNESRCWNVRKRYSDFRTLHNELCQKFPMISQVKFPERKAIGKYSSKFLERRQRELNKYFDVLLSSPMLTRHQGLLSILLKFLEQEPSINNNDNVFFTDAKSVPDDVTDMASKNQSSQLNDEDSGPFRLAMTLVSELFDTRQTRIGLLRTTLIQSLIRVFGDRINRRVREMVNWLLSEDQLVVYLDNMLKCFWPQGHLASPGETPDEDAIKLAGFLARAKLLGSFPEDLRRIIGNDSTIAGLETLHSCFQHELLNQRLLIVLLEQLVICLLPKSNVRHILAGFHSQSPRLKSVSDNGDHRKNVLSNVRFSTKSVPPRDLKDVSVKYIN